MRRTTIRHQNGYIFRKGDSWFGRWREDAIVDGQVVRRQHCEKLCECGDRYRRESDVRPLLEDKLRLINSGRADARSTLSVAEFGESYWLPWIEENCKPSTVGGYKAWWKVVKPRVEGIALRDFRTVHTAELLATLHTANGLGRNSLKHVKSLLSGIFTLARNQGVLDSPNPVRGAMLPKRATAPADMHAATVEEVITMLDALQNKGEAETGERLRARVAVALCFFAGLRPSEARGARWEDFDGHALTIRQSVWHTHATEPKTAAAMQAVPVIEPLKGLLRHKNLATTDRHYIKTVPENTLAALKSLEAVCNQCATPQEGRVN